MNFIILTTMGVITQEEGKQSKKYILIYILVYFSSVSIYSHFSSILSLSPYSLRNDVQDDMESGHLIEIGLHSGILCSWAWSKGQCSHSISLSFSLTGKFSFFGETLVQRRENRELTAKMG